MNNSKKKQKKYTYRGRIIRRIILQHLFALIGFVVLYIAALFFAVQFLSSFTWYGNEPLYHFLLLIQDNIILFSILVCLIAWFIITYYFMARPLRYLDEIINASTQLAIPGQDPIILPSDALKSVQDDLNQVREQAYRNAMLAKEAEQRKNDLIVYLAHDLKTPLTSVIGYLTLLHDEPEISTELRAKYVGIALNKAERLEDLINEFFDITRFNLTTLTLENEHTNLSRMLEQITSEFTPILTEKRLYWNTNIMPDVHMICDRDKLERVFDNLIRNAVNYSYPDTAISLSMSSDGEKIDIRIANHGKTIPPEKLSHIFEQFFRLDSSRSSSTGGAGLGLAISKEIVELHGGAITAQSENESISFTVLLPVNRQKIVRNS